jgi:hypothetical protein
MRSSARAVSKTTLAITTVAAAASIAYLIAPRRPTRSGASPTAAAAVPRMQPTTVASEAPRAVNLRDLGQVAPNSPLLPRRVYRCSQVFAPSLLRELNIKTVVDLRGKAEARRARKHDAARQERAGAGEGGEGLRPLHALAEQQHQQVLSSDVATAGAAAADAAADAEGDALISALARAEQADTGDAPSTVAAVAEDAVAQGPAIVAVPVEAAMAASSFDGGGGGGGVPPASTAAAPATTTTTTTVDLLPPWRLALEAARRFPLSVLASAAAHALTLRDPRPVISEAFANERMVGLRRYYEVILSGSGPAIGAAMRALAQPGALPGLVHCAVGKDRTGVICALILSLCGVPDDAIAADYAVSERELRRFRRSLVAAAAGGGSENDDHDDAAGDDDHDDPSWPVALSERMIAANADVALATLQELRDKYSGAECYLLTKGRMTKEEVAALKKALIE